MNFRFAVDSDYEEIALLFRLSFNDDLSEICEFLEYFRKDKDFSIAVCEDENRIISMMCLIPARFRQLPAFYVYGVCTAPDFRSRGISNRLMDFVKANARQKNISCLFLVPASASLSDFYSKQGFLCFPAPYPCVADILSNCVHAMDAFADCTYAVDNRIERPYTADIFIEEIKPEEYLLLRSSILQKDSVFSMNDYGNLFALNQRDISVHLAKTVIPDSNAPAGFIYQEKEAEIILLEITSASDELLLNLPLMIKDVFSRKSSHKTFSFRPGNPVCIYPFSDMPLPALPYFAFPMDTIL